jgi:hypothetical protein
MHLARVPQVIVFQFQFINVQVIGKTNSVLNALFMLLSTNNKYHKETYTSSLGVLYNVQKYYMSTYDLSGVIKHIKIASYSSQYLLITHESLL